MLDQNTDRMWYVIGAVLIGAAIILAANTFMPSAFASVGGMFDDVISTIDVKSMKRYLTNDDIYAIGANKNVDRLQPLRGRQMTFDSGRGFAVWQISGLRLKDDAHDLEYSESGHLGFDLWIPSEYDDVLAAIDINMSPTEGGSWAGNDNDKSSNRKLYVNGVEVSNHFRSIPMVAGEWNHIVVAFENTHSQNVNQVPIRNHTNIGLHRPEESVDKYGYIPTKIRNVYVRTFAANGGD